MLHSNWCSVEFANWQDMPKLWTVLCLKHQHSRYRCVWMYDVWKFLSVTALCCSLFAPLASFALRLASLVSFERNPRACREPGGARFLLTSNHKLKNRCEKTGKCDKRNLYRVWQMAVGGQASSSRWSPALLGSWDDRLQLVRLTYEKDARKFVEVFQALWIYSARRNRSN